MKSKYYDEYRNFGLTVSYYRRVRGMTQQQLAEKMDVRCETISRIENAYTGLSMDTLFKLSGALNVSLSDLSAHAKL